MRGWMDSTRSCGRHLLRLAVALHDDAGVARQVLRIAQVLERAFQVVFEDIGHGDEFDVLVAGEQVHGGLRAAAAAADQSGAQFLLPGAAHQVGLDDGESGGARGQHGAPGNRIRWIWHDAGIISPGGAGFNGLPGGVRCETL